MGFVRASLLSLVVLSALVGSTGCSSDPSASSELVDGGLDAGGSFDCKTTAGVLAKVLQPNCGSGGCHSAKDVPDLVSPGLEARVVGVAASDPCGSDVLVVAGDPGKSFLFNKIESTSPRCGAPMPVRAKGAAGLSAEELACVRDWIAALPTTPKTDGGVVDTGPKCAAGETDCSGKCVDTQTDATDCGACGKACTGGQPCVAGACVAGCPTGTTLCGGKCVDTKADAANCGACGKTCAAGQVCAAGACGCGTTVSFSKDVQPIFTSHCATAGCHAGVMPQEGLNLSIGKAYTELFNVKASGLGCTTRTLVVPSNVGGSYLINKMTGVDKCGSVMPKSGALPATTVDKVRAWICNGALNN